MPNHIGNWKIILQCSLFLECGCVTEGTTHYLWNSRHVSKGRSGKLPQGDGWPSENIERKKKRAMRAWGF